MEGFPFLRSSDKLEAFLTTIKEVVVPERFTYRYLSSIGFSSSQDRALIPLFQHLGFLTQQGVPTADYLKLRDLTQTQQVLEKQVKRAYKNIFEIDTKIPDVPKDVLVGYFSRFSQRSRQEVTYMVDTFLQLCSVAGIEHGYIKNETSSKDTSDYKPSIKLSIELPATTDEKVYEAIFKHLKGLIGN